jgi:hypothetical protein
MASDTLTFVAEVTKNSLYNLFWTVEAATKSTSGSIKYNPFAEYFDEVYDAPRALYGDAKYPQSAAIVSYVGLDHTAWSKINFFQSGFAPAPPSAACANSNLGIVAGAAGALAGIISIAGIAAARETGGASLVALGVGGAALGMTAGGLSIANAIQC